MVTCPTIVLISMRARSGIVIIRIAEHQCDQISVSADFAVKVIHWSETETIRLQVCSGN